MNVSSRWLHRTILSHVPPRMEVQEMGYKDSIFRRSVILLNMTKIFKGYCDIAHLHASHLCHFKPIGMLAPKRNVSMCLPSWLEHTWCNLQMYHICRFPLNSTSIHNDYDSQKNNLCVYYECMAWMLIRAKIKKKF